jgi:hypothetical protein
MTALIGSINAIQSIGKSAVQSSALGSVHVLAGAGGETLLRKSRKSPIPLKKIWRFLSKRLSLYKSIFKERFYASLVRD